MKVTIRTALAADSKPIARILAQCSVDPSFCLQDQKFQQQNVRQYLGEISQASGQEVLVAVTPTGLVVGYLHQVELGMMYLPGPELLVSQLFVSPAHQGEEVERQLLEHVERYAKTSSAVQIRVLGDTMAEHTDLAVFSGYEQIAPCSWKKGTL